MMKPDYAAGSLRKPVILLLLLLSLALIRPLDAEASSIRSLTLQQMADKAALIIHATVSSQQVEIDPVSQQVVTITHFDVIETLKGSAGSTHSIKQLGGHLPGSNLVHKVHGIPKFVNGQDYIVFLPPVSSLGFSSPIGLHQGKFSVREESGSKVVRRHPASASHKHRHTHTHEHAHSHDAARGNTAAKTTDHVGLDDFKAAVMDMVAR